MGANNDVKSRFMSDKAKKDNHLDSPHQHDAKNEAAMNTKVLERYLEHMEQSSKRWEKMVFPAMVAFIVLAGYGFFLVNSLSSDMRSIATTLNQDFRREMISIGEDMHNMTEQVALMRDTVATMSDKMDPLAPMLDEIAKLDQSVDSINVSVQHVDESIDHMDDSIDEMNRSVRSMGRDMDDISDSFDVPFGPMKKFLPW